MHVCQLPPGNLVTLRNTSTNYGIKFNAVVKYIVNVLPTETIDKNKLETIKFGVKIFRIEFNAYIWKENYQLNA